MAKVLMSVSGLAYRLVGGDNGTRAGRVEVRVNGVWGTLCQPYYYFWDETDASVLCRSLGYTDGEPLQVRTGFLLCGIRGHSHLISSHLIYPRSLADRWGTTVDFTTSFLHSSRFSAFCSMMLHSRPVQSLMLSSHRFLCLPLCPPP